ncbi:hypothetical protein PZ897_15665 [Hoeflea sp. YIM 152468]|uniref:hypothetical protein n=1 Tax=Hoeflea sp. YIM 152468 TaxID=3031759 RepID=UPI0023DB073B|nr:hypothetical protein [Hoeflea sp. YIM 152468]MDF1609623.1 hypothetical protein [Hoeflea sp. YIM 152468]
MNSFIRNTLAALVVATAGVAASAPAASAGDIGFSLSIGGAGSSIVVRDRDRRGGWNRFEGHRRDSGRNRSACQPHRAVNKARRMGLRRAHVVRANHRRVVVEGLRHHRSVRVAFANQRSCPVLNVRR